MFTDFRLKVFMAVAEKGNFTYAARELGVSQPAVSQNISELEKTLDCQLFNRGRGSITLTQQGEVFKSYAERILHWYQEAADVFSGQKEAVVPQCLKISETQDAEIYSADGEIHIRYINK